MKIRSDYVSNSSSSSFIIGGTSSGGAAKMFYNDFLDFLYDYEPMGDSMRVNVKTKELEDSWYSIDFLEFIDKVNSNENSFDDLIQIEFYCDDYDHVGMMYLNLLWRYFKTNGYDPDDSNTEHEFRNTDENPRCFVERLFEKINIGRKD